MTQALSRCSTEYTHIDMQVNSQAKHHPSAFVSLGSGSMYIIYKQRRTDELLFCFSFVVVSPPSLVFVVAADAFFLLHLSSMIPCCFSAPFFLLPAQINVFIQTISLLPQTVCCVEPPPSSSSSTMAALFVVFDVGRLPLSVRRMEGEGGGFCVTGEVKVGSA